MNKTLSFVIVIACILAPLETVSAQASRIDPRDIGKPIPYVLVEEKDNVDVIPYVLVNRGNYENRSWIISIRTGKTIGYAPWNNVTKRWTLISLDSKYMGFIQATVGELRKPEVYTQYLRYDRDNQYTGVMIKALGGGPKTRDLPYGELGGELNPYAIGNLPMKFSGLETYIDVVRAPMGIDVTVGGPQ
jgi:hypothetical protein